MHSLHPNTLLARARVHHASRALCRDARPDDPHPAQADAPAHARRVLAPTLHERDGDDAHHCANLVAFARHACE